MCDWLVPQELMVKAVQQTVNDNGGKPGIDNWGEAERVACRSHLPERYQHIESDLIGRYAGNIRRNPDKFGYKSPNSKTHGRTKGKRPDSYDEYMNGLQWRTWKELCFWPFWENVYGVRCCVMCSSQRNLDVHHRHYETFKNESPTDCSPVCRNCHEKHHGK